MIKIVVGGYIDTNNPNDFYKWTESGYIKGEKDG